jgi:hypothetical protein
MTKPIEAKGLSWITDKKARYHEVPWFKVEGPRMYGEVMNREVLKIYNKDLTEKYARFHVRAWLGDGVESSDPHAQVDLGDEYISNVMQGELVEVLGEPPTAEQQLEFASIRNRAVPSDW